VLVTACEVFKGRSEQALGVAMDQLEKDCDFLIIDNPDRDIDARCAVEALRYVGDPMNDSFVDFSLIGQVDPETSSEKNCRFAELIWGADKAQPQRRP
jgi:chromosome partitioning protein